MTSLSVIPPADQERWHELIKAAPLVIVLLYMRTRGDRPVTQAEIAENFQITRNTAARYLRQLSLKGLVTHTGHNNGYLSTEAGFTWLFELGCSKSEHPSLSLIDSNIKKNEFKKERKKEMLKNLTSDRILSETGRLWRGHRVTHYGLSDMLQPDYVMAWLAQAYEEHRCGYISWPWALVYRRMQEHALPERKYQEDPLCYLPNDFLAVLGLAGPEIVDIKPEEELDIVRETEITVAVDARIDDAWQTILSELRQDMPKASFETWVRESYPVHYDYDNDLLSIAVRNQYAADWCESRLTDTVKRLLTGTLPGNVQVEFIVAV